MVSVVQKNQAGIQALLQNRSEQEKAWVLEHLEAMGTTIADPWYLQLANITLLGAILEKAPTEIRHSMHECQVTLFKELNAEVESLSTVKSAAIEANLSDSLQRMLASPAQTPPDSDERAEKPEEEKNDKSTTIRILINVAIVVGAIATGSLLTLWALPSGYTVGGKPLSTDDALALNWVNSEEGQLARHLIEWNGTRLTTGQCVEEGIQLKVGDLIATSGVCTLFVADPRKVSVVKGEGDQ